MLKHFRVSQKLDYLHSFFPCNLGYKYTESHHPGLYISHCCDMEMDGNDQWLKNNSLHLMVTPLQIITLILKNIGSSSCRRTLSSHQKKCERLVSCGPNNYIYWRQVQEVLPNTRLNFFYWHFIAGISTMTNPSRRIAQGVVLKNPGSFREKLIVT